MNSFFFCKGRLIRVSRGTRFESAFATAAILAKVSSRSTCAEQRLKVVWEQRPRRLRAEAPWGVLCSPPPRPAPSPAPTPSLMCREAQERKRPGWMSGETRGRSAGAPSAASSRSSPVGSARGLELGPAARSRSSVTWGAWSGPSSWVLGLGIGGCLHLKRAFPELL